MHCTKISRVKVVINHNTQLLVQTYFDRRSGLASALIAQIGFLEKSALKMHCTKKIFWQKLLQIKSHIFYDL